MDKAKDEVINKLIAGQEKMGKEIAEIRIDITELKQGQKKLEADVTELKQGQKKLEADVTVLKADVTELKQGQKKLEADVTELKQGQKQTDGLILKVLDNIARLERIVVVNVENDLRTKVDTLSDADKVRQHETADLKQICREQEEKLENHDIRISRLEKDEKKSCEGKEL